MPKRRTVGKKIFDVALFAVTCVFIILAMVVPVFFIVPAAIGGTLWYFLSFHSDIEYEYIYYDGEFRFAKIRAKSKRKNLGEVQMEDVIRRLHPRVTGAYIMRMTAVWVIRI